MRSAKWLWVAAVGALPCLCGASIASDPRVPLPAGIAIRMTVEGPVFVDAQGMTLYELKFDGSCTDRPQTLLRYQADAEGSVNLNISVPDVATRKTCAEKHPPLRAPADARPIGLWSVQRSEDGVPQWAYNGKLLYTSTKDKHPGEMNGAEHSPLGSDETGRSPWGLASAPLPGAPGGITVTRTAAGLALANFAGKALYYPEPTGGAPNSTDWQPLTAPEGAVGHLLKDWSVVTRSGGTKQWAYQGKPLYTFAADSDSPKGYLFADTYGRPYGEPAKGWHLVLLAIAPGHPAEVTVRSIVDTLDPYYVEKKVYATKSGLTLYTVQCIEDTEDHLECDDVGDSPSYWLNFCGGEEHCQQTWHPLPAPADARPIGDFWSVRVIDRHHPWRVPQTQDTLRIWAYRGRVVFSYSGDTGPGSYNGWTSFATGVIQVLPVLAYEPVTP